MFTKVPEWRSDEGNLENVESKSEIHPALIARQRLGILVYHIKGKSLYRGQLVRSCRRVNGFADCQLKNRLEVARKSLLY